MISDFFSSSVPGHTGQNGDYAHMLKRSLAVANKRHDVIAVTLNDPRELRLSECGLISLEDAETGQTLLVDTSDASVRRAYEQANAQRIAERERLFRSVGTDHIDISTDVPYADAIVKFFAKRRRRRR